MDTRPTNLARSSEARRKPRIVQFSTLSPDDKARTWRALVRDVDRELKRRGITAAQRRELRRSIGNGA